jgi:GT2 family glycosyltransferase
VSSLRATVLLMSVDEAPMLAHSLPAALAAAGGDHDVVVVDNACSDETGSLAERHGAGLLRLPRRLSYAAAINVAIAQTGGDAVLLLNADCFVEPAFLAAAVPRLAEPAVGSVAPKLMRASGPAGAAASLRQIDAAGMGIDRRRKNGLVGHGRPAAAFAAPGEAFGADGAAALYRRETLEDCALGGGEVLDEDMQLWASDADLAWRARLLGWRCAYEPLAVAHHIRTYSPSTREQMSEEARRLQFRNRLLMIAKNETAAGLRRDWAWIAGYELLALGHVTLRERHLLRGYADAARLLARARGRRRLVQARRRVDRPEFGLAPRA